MSSIKVDSTKLEELSANRVYILITLILMIIFLVACDSTKKLSEEPKESSTAIGNQVTLEQATELKPEFDLSNPTFYQNFISYFDMDKESLFAALKKTYDETPVEGIDEKSGLEWIKLKQAGLQFYLTEEAGIPVSQVDIMSSSPIHFGKTKGGMNFADIMKQLGETIIDAGSLGTTEDRTYRISYPLDEFSVNFTTTNVFEDSAVMSIHSWGYYDEKPTLLNPNEIITSYGTLTLPDSWIGRIAIEDIGNEPTILYLGRHSDFPLFRLSSMNITEWSTLSQSDQAQFHIISQDKDWIVAVTTTFTNRPNNEQELSEFNHMKLQLEEIWGTFKSTVVSDEIEEGNLSYLCNNSTLELLNIDRVVTVYEEAHNMISTDESEFATDEYFSEMGKCYSSQIDKLTSKDSSLKISTNKLLDHIKELNGTWFTVHYLADGGGTMWSHFSSRRSAMVDVAVYIYLNQLEINLDQKINKDQISERIDQLSKYREFYYSGSIETINESDIKQLKEARQQLVGSYDNIISILKEMPQSEAAMNLFDFLLKYDDQIY
ncbi:hypothetical protein [Paenibacillus lutimineralis]|uniref:Uncharacterized protein n=1 Tax=Paenibacillus lutimineralis TaxID=2707005 RepID=A0A3Q9I6X6_9BACL|nr:hypothetical protein [Paenibacillus lutimineralis]AZS14043.1 hypothetical protein EI981_05960 [Paenibacillus lutimineralis]